MAQLDRPVAMRWTYSGLHGGVHCINVRAPKNLRSPLVSVFRDGTGLSVDTKSCLSVEETQTQVFATQMLALAHGLRHYAGFGLGQLVITAVEADTLDVDSEFRPLFQMQIGSEGWLHALGKTAQRSIPELWDTPQMGLCFVRDGVRDWLDPFIS